MRLPAAVLVTCLLSSAPGCSAPPPIDPNDPLIGSWAFAEPYGTTLGRLGWVFGGDGHYQFVPRREGAVIEQGEWERIDDLTITRCKSPCTEAVQSQVRIETSDELEIMIIDGRIAVDGTWKVSMDSGCFQHGSTVSTRAHYTLKPDGTASVTDHFCNGSPAPPEVTCNGTWFPSPPLGISVSVPFPCHSKTFFHLGGMISPDGFLRVDPP